MAWYYNRELRIDKSGKFVVVLSSKRVKHIFTIDELSDENKSSLINSYIKLNIPMNYCITLHNVSKNTSEEYFEENGIIVKRIYLSSFNKMKYNCYCIELARKFKDTVLQDLCNAIRNKDDLSKYTWDVLDSMCLEKLGYNAQVCFFIAYVFSLVESCCLSSSYNTMALKDFNCYANIFENDNEFYYDSSHFYKLCDDLDKDDDTDDYEEDTDCDEGYEGDDIDRDFHIEPDKNIVSQIIKTHTYFNFNIDTISKLYNLSQYDIEAILKNANIEIKNFECPGDIEKLERVKRLKKYNQWANSYIANEFGVSTNVIDYILVEDTKSNVKAIDPAPLSNIKSDFNNDIASEVKNQIVNTYTKFGIGVKSLTSIFDLEYLYKVDNILCEKLRYEQGVANSGDHMMTTNIYCKDNIKHVLFLISQNKDRLEIAKLFGVSKETIDFIYDNCKDKVLFNIYDKDNSCLYKNNMIEMNFPYNSRPIFNNIDVSKLRIGEEVTLKILGSINSLSMNYIGITTSSGKTIIVDINDIQL